MAKKKKNTSSGYAGIEEGFLYKPVSERGTLVILLPSKNRDSKVTLKTPDGKVLEHGVSHGYANGNREHFRFNQEGGKYPDGTVIEVTRADGSTVRHQVTNTSARWELGGSSGGSGSGPTSAAALNLISGNTGNITKPNISERFAPKQENYSFKSPLSVLETIRSVSNIVAGSTKNFNQMSTRLDAPANNMLTDFFEGKAEDAQAAESTELTAIPKFDMGNT